MSEHEYHDIPSKPVTRAERLASKRGQNPYTGITKDWPGYYSLGKGYQTKRAGSQGKKMGPLTEENRG